MPEKYGQDAGCMNKDKWYTVRKKPASTKDNDYMGEKNNDGCFNWRESFFQNLPAEVKTPDRIDQVLRIINFSYTKMPPSKVCNIATV